MKSTNLVTRLCVGLATFGLVIPFPTAVNGAEQSVASRRATPIADVSLVSNGVLQGQVISSQGQPLASAPVVVHHGKTEVAKTSTDVNGQFQVANLKGGVYVVSTDGAAGVIRAWTEQAAPPSSAKGVLLVPQSSTARAQLGSEDTNWGLAALVVGGVLATVLVVALDHSSGS